MNRRRSAFSLPEVMVSLAVLGIVSVFLMDLLSLQTQNYQVVDQVGEAQTNLRVITTVIEQEIRLTGFMAPEGGVICGVDNTGAPDILVLTDAAAVNPAGLTENDLGMNITLGYDGTNLDTLVLSGNGTVEGVPAYDTDGNGVADSDLMMVAALGQAGAIIVTDRNNPSRGTSCGQIRLGSLTVGGTTTTVTIDYDFATINGSQPLRALTAGDNPQALVAIPATVYRINAANQLTRNGIILAEDVEDMQVALHFDVNDDGIVDGDPQPAPGNPPFRSDTEYPGSIVGGVRYLSGAWDHSTLREVRVGIVIRTRAQDTATIANPALANNTFIPLENRVAPAQPPDGFRRRALAMTVQPRNIGRR